MQNIEEGGNSIASHFANLSLLNECVVEEGGSILLFLLTSITSGVTISLFLCCHSRDVESHLNELIAASASLLALATRAANVVGAGVVGVLRKRHLDSDLIATRQVGISDF